MLEQEKIIKISLIVSLIGILILLALITFINPRYKNIGEIDEKDLGNKIITEGKIRNLNDYDGFQVILLQDPNNLSSLIKVTSYSSIINNSLKNKEVQVTGRVSTYNNDLQIEADKITILV